MTQVLITESYLEDIADAIREKSGSESTYTPAQMATAIENIPSAEEPDLVTKAIVANGTYSAEDEGHDGYSQVAVQVPNSYDASDEGKVVSNGALVAQTSVTKTANGTYDTTLNNEVVVNVSGGGGGGGISYDGVLLITATQYKGNSANVLEFFNSYARVKHGSSKGSQSGPGVIASDGCVTDDDLPAFIQNINQLTSGEYYGSIYGNTNMISTLGLVLLGDFASGGSNTGNILSDSIENYSGVLLQGIYNKARSSSYNTSMLYLNPQLNTEYWAGMKDRNSSYDCGVTFTDTQTVSLTGNKQVIIYGIP